MKPFLSRFTRTSLRNTFLFLAFDLIQVAKKTILELESYPRFTGLMEKRDEERWEAKLLEELATSRHMQMACDPFAQHFWSLSPAMLNHLEAAAEKAARERGYGKFAPN